MAHSHTSDEVGDTIGELLNQILGDFIKTVRMLEVRNAEGDNANARFHDSWDSCVGIRSGSSQ